MFHDNRDHIELHSSPDALLRWLKTLLGVTESEICAPELLI